MFYDGAGFCFCRVYRLFGFRLYFDERITIEDVFQDKNYTNEWLAYAYEFLNNNEMQQIGSKKTIAFNFADDMYYGDSDYSGWRCGTYTETSSKINLNMWENAYKAIRQTSIFLNNVDMNKELSAADIEDMKGQAHFLRAYFLLGACPYIWTGSSCSR